jgi:acyl-CoA synthetase (AMP-forming)/AMP-acid ligase II/thioesterase domain-containing protein
MGISTTDSVVGRCENVSGLLLNAARLFPGSGVRIVHATGDDGVLINYQELLDQARRIAGGLLGHGLCPGAKVALLLERVEEFIPAFWGCILNGMIPCALVPIRNDPERWTRYLSHLDGLLDHPLVVTTQSLMGEVSGLEVMGLEDLRAAPVAMTVHQAGPGDACLVVLTSGSTGNAKAVSLTHGNVLASMAGKQELRKLGLEDIVLNWINFDHVAALLEAHMLAVFSGATCLHVDAGVVLGEPLELLRIIDRYRVTTSLIPNFLIGQLNSALESARSQSRVPDVDLSCVRHIITGGESNVVETGRRFLELLAPLGLAHGVLWPGFGMTETCAGVCYSNEFPEVDADHEFAALGFPIKGAQIRIADSNDKEVSVGESGELQLRGGMVFGGYYNSATETRAAFTADGWFRSGDLARIESGRLNLVGRKKDCLIVSGVNYFSHELESVLESLDGIERSYIAAFPTRPKGADTEQLVVTFAPAFAVEDEAKLYQLIVGIRNTAVLLWGFRPSIILPLPRSEFPRTSMGKIQRSLLRKRLEAGDFAAQVEQMANLTRRQLGGYAPPATPAEGQIAEIYASLFDLDRETLSVTASFFDLGGTSLDIIKLTRQLAQVFGVADVSMATILQNPTARALAGYFARGGSGSGQEYDPIVSLQRTGRGTPLFCIHSAIGEILVFFGLAKYFVNERPFYALRARGLNPGEEPFLTIDEMADNYFQAIRRIQPKGPYAIAGYSLGGMVGFEVSKRLEAIGERVAFFCSIDAPPRTLEPICPDYCSISLAFFLGLIKKDKMLKLIERYRADEPGLNDQLIQIADSRRLAELDLDARKFKEWMRIAVSLGMMGKDYVPSGNVESATVLYANPRWVTLDSWLNDQLRGWDAFVRRGARYIQVPGEHHSLLDVEHLNTFQSVLRAELKRAFPDG